MDNPWFISIVGGIISTIIGGFILGNAGKFSYGGGPGPIITFMKLIVFGIMSIAFIAIVFSNAVPPGALDFGQKGLDPVIRVLLILFGEGAFFLQVFYGINIFK